MKKTTVAGILSPFVANPVTVPPLFTPGWPISWPSAATRRENLRGGRWSEKRKYVHWIGLRENLQETMVFTIKYRAFLQIFPSSNSMICGVARLPYNIRHWVVFLRRIYRKPWLYQAPNFWGVLQIFQPLGTSGSINYDSKHKLRLLKATATCSTIILW